VSCSPGKAGVDLLVTGKTFSLVDVIVDGNNINEQGSDKEKQSMEGIVFIPVSTGIHHIVLIGRDSKRVEIKAKINLRENYLSYDSDAGIIQWNDNEYPVAFDTVIAVK
jgi:hypothetical protein